MMLPRVTFDPVMLQTFDIIYPERVRKLARSPQWVKRMFIRESFRSFPARAVPLIESFCSS